MATLFPSRRGRRTFVRTAAAALLFAGPPGLAGGLAGCAANPTKSICEAVAQKDHDQLALNLRKSNSANERCGGSTPLHQAVNLGDDAAVDLLLNAGAEVNARDQLAKTPLHIAAN